MMLKDWLLLGAVLLFVFLVSCCGAYLTKLLKDELELWDERRAAKPKSD